MTCDPKYKNDGCEYNIIIIIIIFWHSVDIFPREFKNWDIQNWVQIYQSVQSGIIVIILLFLLLFIRIKKCI